MMTAVLKLNEKYNKIILLNYNVILNDHKYVLLICYEQV